MEETNRNFLIEWLYMRHGLRNGYDRSYYENLSDARLDAMYSAMLREDAETIMRERGGAKNV